MKSFINKLTGIAGFKIVRTTPSLGNRLAQYGIPKNEYAIAGSNITFSRLGITLGEDKAQPLLEGYANAFKLKQHKNAEFYTDDVGRLTVKVENVSFTINDEEEFFILCEVFLEGSYNFNTPSQKKVSLIDIGMNVGITSLYYASKENVESVFSFEPFEPTYKMALQNISNNKNAGAKIQANNFGMAAKDATLKVEYSLQQKGRMGFDGLPQSTVAKTDVSFQEICLKPVTAELDKIKEKIKGNFVVCKIDCEGAEYEIMDALAATENIKLPDVYFIEWHYKPVDTMVKHLMDNGYNVINTAFSTMKSGMLYAFRNNS